ncbi:MAG: 30S ribosomal protein S20 [Chloroflexi bacterium]|nr:30S ribosomal protein S20 [Chloroflexota bacterium]MBL7061516.1 30S ribosomal protein S20 [Dehalococcoidia bacterium]
MPKSKSAEKAARASERKRLRNKSVRSATKTHLIRAEKLISGNELESAQQAVLAATSALDRAAKKGAIHPNTAARHKSRLMKKFNQAKLASTAEQKTTSAEAA